MINIIIKEYSQVTFNKEIEKQTYCTYQMQNTIWAPLKVSRIKLWDPCASCLLQRDFILGTNLVSFSLKSPQLVISSQLLFFSSKSFTALKSHSAKYEDGNVKNSFLAKLVEIGYLVSVSSQSHTIAPFMLNKVLSDSSLCISEFFLKSQKSTSTGHINHVGKSICFKSENLSFKSKANFFRWSTMTSTAASVNSHSFSQWNWSNFLSEICFWRNCINKAKYLRFCINKSFISSLELFIQHIVFQKHLLNNSKMLFHQWFAGASFQACPLKSH